MTHGSIVTVFGILQPVTWPPHFSIFCPESFHGVFILIINKLRQDPTQAFIQIHIQTIKIRKIKSILVTIMLPVPIQEKRFVLSFYGITYITPESEGEDFPETSVRPGKVTGTGTCFSW